jgi:hypothetical protein
VIPGVDGAIYVGILLGIGLINLLWGVIGAWSNSALTWRYSILADWGLLLVALGLLSRGALGAAVLLIAWILLIKGPLMLLSISDVGPPNPSIDSGAGRGLTIVFGMMLVGGAPFIGFPIRLLILKAASGLYWPLAAVLGVLFLAWVGHGFKLARTLQIRPGRRRLAAYVILVLGTAIGLYPAGLLQIAGLA